MTVKFSIQCVMPLSPFNNPPPDIFPHLLDVQKPQVIQWLLFSIYNNRRLRHGRRQRGGGHRSPMSHPVGRQIFISHKHKKMILRIRIPVVLCHMSWLIIDPLTKTANHKSWLYGLVLFVISVKRCVRYWSVRCN